MAPQYFGRGGSGGGRSVESSGAQPDMFTDLAMAHAARGDLIDYIRNLERRIARLEAQLNTN